MSTNKKPKPIPDRADQLLAEREGDYQAALQIARNDLKLREALLNRVKSYGLSDQAADDALTKMISDTRRARRDVVSEPGYRLFEDDLRNYAAGLYKDLTKEVLKTESGERKRSQPIPGTHAHHPASVSSTESIVQNMDEEQIRRLWNIAASKGYTIGSHADGFIPLSEPAHLTGGRNWGNDYAHVGVDGTPDPGRFKRPALPKGTTAEQAWTTLKPILDEQRLLNDNAYNHPVEARMRADAEATLGRPIEWKGPVTANRAAQNAEAGSQGVNATTITKAYDRNPGLLGSSEVPNVTVAVPGGARVPRDLPKPTKPPAIRVGRSPSPIPVASKPTPQPVPVASKPKDEKLAKPTRRRLPKPGKGSRTSSRVQLLGMTPPSQERFGPGAMMSTIDLPHERQFTWGR